MKTNTVLDYETGLRSIEESISCFRNGTVSSIELIPLLVWGVNLIIAENAFAKKIEEGK